MRNRRHAPHHDRQREAHARAEAIHQSSGEEQAHGVRQLKREHDIGVVDLAPSELGLERWLEQPDDLSIEVVDRRGEEQQRADDPASVPSWNGAYCGLITDPYTRGSLEHLAVRRILSALIGKVKPRDLLLTFDRDEV